MPDWLGLGSICGWWPVVLMGEAEQMSEVLPAGSPQALTASAQKRSTAQTGAAKSFVISPDYGSAAARRPAAIWTRRRTRAAAVPMTIRAAALQKAAAGAMP